MRKLCAFRLHLVGEDEELFRRHRLSEKEALRIAAAAFKEEFFLFLRFDAFAKHEHVEVLAEGYDAAHDFFAAVGGLGGEQHRPVNFHDIHVEVLEHRDGRVAGAEIVHGDDAPHFLHRRDNGRGIFLSVLCVEIDEGRFRDLKVDGAVGTMVTFEDFAQTVEIAGVAQMKSGLVD